MNAWPFDQPPNCAVFTLRQIIFDSAPILRESHEEDDHGWQFLGLGDAREEDAAIVALSTIVKYDPSVLEVADLPPGWRAWRCAVGERWVRAPAPLESDHE